MIYELRTYTLQPGKQGEYLKLNAEVGRKIRRAFVADEGHKLVQADYSQIELRIMAHISEDQGLLDAFARGEDIHRATAAEIFGRAPAEVAAEERRYAKVINFGLIYGMSSFGLASNLGITRDAAKLYIDRYFARYPGVAAYMENTRTSAKANGFVETVFGRRLWLPEINGGSGRSLLIGGKGSDSVTGGSDDDIVIGCYTSFDTNNAALMSIATACSRWQPAGPSFSKNGRMSSRPFPRQTHSTCLRFGSTKMVA